MAKPAAERKRPRLGDVIEIETPRGLTYAHYTHEHRDPPRMGSLLRVLPGFYDVRPAEFERLVEEEERFAVFFPLAAALNRGIVRIAANAPIAKPKREFPTFRSRVESRGEVGPWWMWDGKREWLARQGERGTAGAVNELWNDTLLIERITEDWTPAEND